MIGIFGERQWQEFQRDFAAELVVLGQIDFAHAALAEQGNDFVVADALTGGKLCLFVHENVVTALSIAQGSDGSARACGSIHSFAARICGQVRQVNSLRCYLLPRLSTECSLTTGS